MFPHKNEKGTSYFPDIVKKVEKYAKFMLVISQFLHIYYFQVKQKTYTLCTHKVNTYDFIKNCLTEAIF